MHLLNAPPGISGDAARLGLYALDLLKRNLWPFYIEHQLAPHPLAVYVQAPVFAVFGFKLAALRGVTAFAGALAVPAVYHACREILTDQDTRFARRAGVLAALGLALSPFFALFSRYGIEGALLPVIELLSVASLWRGLRQGRWVDFLLAGGLVGLSQYAYIVARAFPVALAAACLIAIITDRRLLTHWRGLVLAVSTAVIVTLPQLLLHIRAPYTFFARTQQTAGRFIFALPDAAAIFGAKLANQLLMLGWRWDNAYNPYSGRPLLNPVLFLGLLLALVLVFRSRPAAQRFSVTMAALMLVPDLITFEGLTPSATRVYAAVPFIMMLAGMGCATLWQWLQNRPHLSAQVGSLVLVAVLLAGTESQWDFAHRVMSQVKATDGLEWRASLIEIAEASYIEEHLDETILVPTSEYQRAPLAFLLAEHFPDRASGIPTVPLKPGETITVVSPLEPERATTEGQPSGYIPDEWVLLKNGAAYFLPPLSASIEPAGSYQPLLASNGAIAATTFTARWTGLQPRIQPLSASFQNGLDLVGYHATEFLAGRPVTVTLYWQPRRRIAADVQIFVQILGRDNNVIAAVHDWPLRGTYRVRAWNPGETMPLSYSLSIPADAAPGPYRLIAGVFDIIHQRRVLLQTGEDLATVGTFKVPLPPSHSVPEYRLKADFGQMIQLSGYTLTPTTEGLSVTLFWQAKRVPDADYTIFVHITDANDNIVAQADSQPLYGQYPTSIWSLGESIVEERRIPVPAGEHQVFVGLYRWETLERLPATLDGQRLQDDRLLLDTIKVP
jgi:hypothetical protein